MTAQASRTGGEPTDDPPSDGAAAVRGPLPVAPTVLRSELPPTPALKDFIGSAETRLRDLLAFGMAAEAGRPPGPDGIEGLRRKADAELEAHAFRVLHNQVEAIRRQAMDEQLARTGRGLSFLGAVAANLAALLLGGALLLALLAYEPSVFTRAADHIAQLLAQLSAR